MLATIETMREHAVVILSPLPVVSIGGDNIDMVSRIVQAFQYTYGSPYSSLKHNITSVRCPLPQSPAIGGGLYYSTSGEHISHFG